MFNIYLRIEPFQSLFNFFKTILNGGKWLLNFGFHIIYFCEPLHARFTRKKAESSQSSENVSHSKCVRHFAYIINLPKTEPTHNKEKSQRAREREREEVELSLFKV